MRAARVLAAVVLMLLPVLVAGCAGKDASAPYPGADLDATIRLTSAAFRDGQPIPARYTCDDADVSPSLSMAQVPSAARAFALIMDDPDAPSGTWTHWTWWNVPSSTTSLAEGASIAALGGHEGTTSFGSPGYGGPCPPTGTHRYYFRLYTLDAPLELAAGTPVDTLKEALADRVVARGELMGTYARP